MEFNIKEITIRVGKPTDRSGEPKKGYDKIYMWPEGETVWENLQNRRSRPYQTYKKEIIPQLMEKLKKEHPKVYKQVENLKWGWNENCGCSMCPCSPGFVGDVQRDTFGEVFDIHVTINSVSKSN